MSSQTPNRRRLLRRKRILKDGKDNPEAKRTSPSFDEKTLHIISDDDFELTSPTVQKVKRTPKLKTPKNDFKTYSSYNLRRTSPSTSAFRHLKLDSPLNGETSICDDAEKQNEDDFDSNSNKDAVISSLSNQVFSPEIIFAQSQLPASQYCEVIWDCNSPGYSKEELKQRHKNRRSGGESPYMPVPNKDTTVSKCSAKPSNAFTSIGIGIETKELEKLDFLVSKINSKESSKLKDSYIKNEVPEFLKTSQPFTVTHLSEDRKYDNISIKQEYNTSPSSSYNDNLFPLANRPIKTDTTDLNVKTEDVIPQKIIKPETKLLSQNLALKNIADIPSTNNYSQSSKAHTFKGTTADNDIPAGKMEEMFSDDFESDAHKKTFSCSLLTEGDSFADDIGFNLRNSSLSNQNTKLVSSTNPVNIKNEAVLQMSRTNETSNDITPQNDTTLPKKGLLNSLKKLSAIDDSFDDDFDETVFQSTQIIEDLMYDKKTGKFNSPVMMKSKYVSVPKIHKRYEPSCLSSEVSNNCENPQPSSSPILGKSRSPTSGEYGRHVIVPGLQSQCPSQVKQIQSHPKPTRSAFTFGSCTMNSNKPVYASKKVNFTTNVPNNISMNEKSNFFETKIEEIPLQFSAVQKSAPKPKRMTFSFDSPGLALKTDKDKINNNLSINLESNPLTHQTENNFRKINHETPNCLSTTASKVGMNSGFSEEMDDDLFDIDIDESVFMDSKNILSKNSKVLETNKITDQTPKAQLYPSVSSHSEISPERNKTSDSGPSLIKNSFYSPKSTSKIAGNISKNMQRSLSPPKNPKLGLTSQSGKSLTPTLKESEDSFDEFDDDIFLKGDIMESILIAETQFFSQNPKKETPKTMDPNCKKSLQAGSSAISLSSNAQNSINKSLLPSTTFDSSSGPFKMDSSSSISDLCNAPIIQSNIKPTLSKPQTSNFSRARSSFSIEASSSNPKPPFNLRPNSIQNNNQQKTSLFPRTKSSSSVESKNSLGCSSPPKKPLGFFGLVNSSKASTSNQGFKVENSSIKSLKSSTQQNVKYSQDEIAKKREEALRRRKNKMAKYPPVC